MNVIKEIKGLKMNQAQLYCLLVSLKYHFKLRHYYTDAEFNKWWRALKNVSPYRLILIYVWIKFYHKHFPSLERMIDYTKIEIVYNRAVQNEMLQVMDFLARRKKLTLQEIRNCAPKET